MVGVREALLFFLSFLFACAVFLFPSLRTKREKKKKAPPRSLFLCVCSFLSPGKGKRRSRRSHFIKLFLFSSFCFCPLWVPQKKSWGPKKGRREKVIPASFSAIFSSFPPCFFGGLPLPPKMPIPTSLSLSFFVPLSGQKESSFFSF